VFANPIIRKEVLSSLRTRKAVAMQAAFLLAAAVLIWRSWPADGLQDIGSQLSRRILSILAIGELALVGLFAPAFTAASLTSERERNTLESLFFTAMRPWEIALGKIVGSLGFLVLLVLSGVPALTAPFLLGGISGQEVLAIVGILLLTAIYTGMIGLLISTIMHRSYRSIIVTYAVLLVVYFLFALPAWPVSAHLVNRPSSRIMQGVFHTLASLSPFEAMFSLVLPDSPYAVGAVGFPTYWTMFIPLSVLVIAGTTAVCLIRLRRPPTAPRPREGLRIVERGRGVTARSVLFLIDPRKRKKMIRWWQNPVLLKEFRTRPMLQAQWLLRAVGVCLVTSVLLMLLVAITLGELSKEGVVPIAALASAVTALMVVLLILIGPAATGGTVCGDIETGVWDLMRTTRLSSFRIVSGKFQAAVLPLLLLTLAMLPALFILLYFETERNRWAFLMNIGRVLGVVGMAVLFVATTGMFFSSLLKKTSTATAWTYAVVVTLGLATLLVLLDREGFSTRFVRSVFLVNPVAVAMEAAGTPGLQGYQLFAPHLKIMGAATAAMFLVTVMRVVQLRRAD